MEGFLIALGLITFGVAFSVWRGYILSILWGWFLVPLGVAPVGIAWAIGLSALAYLMWPRATGDKEDGEKEKMLTVAIVTRAVSIPIFCLGLGWIARQFM